MWVTIYMPAIDENDVEHEYQVSGTANAGDPGRTYGDPENCYPPEPAFAEDIQIRSGEIGVEIPESEWARLGLQSGQIEDAILDEASERSQDY